MQGGRPAARQQLATSVAFWGLIGLAVLSAVSRPVASLLGLPASVANVDAILVPLLTAVVVVLVLAAWRQHSTASRVATGALLALALCVLASWALGDVTTWAGIALGFASVILFPLTLFLAAMAIASPRWRAASVVLRVLVLLQLFSGLWQYVAYDVAVRAPFAADLVDGTMSHNIWPAFALPASLVLLIVDREKSRLIWPAAVTLLAIYAEAKAALIVWVPAIALLLALLGFRSAKGRSRFPFGTAPERIAAGSLVAAFVAIIVGGLWWTPSVQGTGSVFLGHSRDLGAFVEDKNQVESTPTLRDAAELLSMSVPATPRSFLLGLGPGNTVSHAAEVLAVGTRSGIRLPPPGPVARSLFRAGQPQLQFEDPQSSLLGLWGDLGAIGSLAYLVAVGTSVRVLLASAWGGRPQSWAHLLTAVLLVLGAIAGGTLLDWPEQASIVLPLTLALLVLAGHWSAPATVAAGTTPLRAAKELAH